MGLTRRLLAAAPLTLCYLLACLIARVSGLSRSWSSFRLRIGPLTIRARRYPTVTRIH